MAFTSTTTQSETVNSLRALAGKLAVAPAQITQRAKDPEWRKKVERPGGRFDVAAALQDQTQRREHDLAKVGGRLQDLKAERLRIQIKRDKAALEVVLREGDLRKIEHDAKRGEWMHRTDVEALCRMLVSGCDRAVRAVGQVTRSTLAETATREALDEWRRKAARWVGKAKGATP
jgi:hypothetical protein